MKRREIGNTDCSKKSRSCMSLVAEQKEQEKQREKKGSSQS